jgi:xylulose-5-phosphate/fructose-6-phosphate phosphoketolase
MLASAELLVTRAAWPKSTLSKPESMNQDYSHPDAGMPAQDACLLACRQLRLGRTDLSLRKPIAQAPLQLSDVKPLVVGHWGTTPGQNFTYVHLNRAINKYDLNIFYVAGPGHGGPAIVGNVYLEGTWSEFYPNVT